MARTTRASASTAIRSQPRRGAVKTEQEPSPVNTEPTSPTPRKRAAPKPQTSAPAKKIKTEAPVTPPDSETALLPSEDEKPSAAAKKASELQARKLKAYSHKTSPFPKFPRPTPADCYLANKILSDLHGARDRPIDVVAPTDKAGCGNSPSVLDALVRTILSQNTSDTNSSRAKRSMDEMYGRSDNWEAVVDGGREKLQEAIKCGGLSAVKSKVIMSILQQTKERYGMYSLEHLRKESDEEAMREMLSFQGVGPKTASCVLLFCLGRESFAVDTHVWRITGLLGWRPAKASRDETHAHLDVRIPDDVKYALHILLVSHGKKCDECKAGGRNAGNCELRKAFRKGKVEDGDEVIKSEVKEEDDEVAVKAEDDVEVKQES